MLKRITRFFLPSSNSHNPTIEYIDLDFVIDYVEPDQQVVRLFRRDSDKPLVHITELWRYGYREYDEESNINFLIKPNDLQILMVLKSLNPKISENGELIFNIKAPILKYLREKIDRYLETPASQALQIESHPAKLHAQIDYDDNGLKARFGISIEGEEKIIDVPGPDEHIEDGYIRIGNTFAPVSSDIVDSRTTKLLQQKSLDISHDALPQFFNEELEFIKKRFKVEFSESAQKIKVNNTPIEPVAYIDYDPDIGISVEIGYPLHPNKITPWADLEPIAGGSYVRIGSTYSRVSEPTDKTANLMMRKEKGMFIIPPNRIPEFFQRDLIILKTEFKAVLTDTAKQLNVAEHINPIIKVSSNEKGWLDFQISVGGSESTVPLSEIFRKRTSQNPYIRIDDYTWINANQKEFDQISKHLMKLDPQENPDGSYRISITQFTSLQDFIEAIGGQSRLDDAYKNFLDQISDFNFDESYQLPSNIENYLHQYAKITLRPYQRSGIQWLIWLQENRLHGILADDMGLGKTIQTICALRLAYEISQNRNHSLIIAPKSVLHHWERELSRVYPSAKVYRYHGAGRTPKLLEAKEPCIFVSTYNTISNDIDHFIRFPFFYFILDEASKIKNPGTKRTRQLKTINAATRIALTGTPIENRPQELWSIFDFTMEGYLGNNNYFIEHYEKPIIEGNKQRSEELGKKIAPFILRRTKDVVAKDLPEKITIIEWCNLSDEQRSLYQTIQNNANELRYSLERGDKINYPGILAILTKLLQLCDHPSLILNQGIQIEKRIEKRSEKYDWIIRKLEEIINTNEKVVIFSRFLGMLSLLESSLSQRNTSYIRIDGRTNNRERLIDHFNLGNATVALCSVQAAGYGINLTSANHVIHADLWWNPAVEDQATDRVHRIGQNKLVYVYKILNEDTLEEKVDSLLQEKRKISGVIMDYANEGLENFSREEIIELLKPI